MATEAGDGRPFVGRAETVDALYRRFEDARAGSGGVTLLVGPTGVGKSTLVGELVRNIRARGTQVLVGRAPALDAPPPFTLIRSALVSVREAPTPDYGLGPAGPGPESVLIGFAPRLDDVAASSPVQIEERLLSALGEADERGESVRDPLWTGITEQFLEFTRRGPTVLVLEDLHRSDEPSLEAVEFLARQMQNRPLWIIATARPFETLSASRASRLEALEAATHARRVTLRPFTSEEVGHFLRWREPDREFSAEEIARRFSETGGNPLLLEQFDRRASARREARPGGVPAPATTETTTLFPALSEEEERILAIGSVLGAEFPFGLLLRSSGENEERLAETVDRLVNAGVLHERPGELLAFSDDRRRENVYDQLTESRRRLLHRKVGEALEATGSADVSTIYALARHFYLGKVDEKSLQYNRAAAEIADRAFSPEFARDHLERALESFRRLRPDDVDGEAELVLEIAQQVDHLGQLKEAETLLRGYLDRRGSAPQFSPHVRALLELYLAQVLTDRGEWKAAEAATAGVLASLQLEDHPLVRLGLHRLRGEALYYEGRYTESLAEHTEELRLARASGNERATALGLVRRAYVLAMIGQAEGAMAEARDASAILERLGDAREAAQAHLFLGVVIAGSPSLTPRYAEASGEFAEAIRLAEKAHDTRRVGWALFNSADILREAGRLDEASERTQRAREILERLGDRFGLVQTMIVQGKIELDRGEYDRAETELLDAYRLVRELQAPADEVDVVLRLAQLSYARGDRATARRRVAELERQNLPALRPDVLPDFERLKNALAAKEGEGDGA
jgi:tetratricopeptide (TPR) repeat protein/energy-coupling factor transporter ATP-binding protein EcfA2